MTKLATAEPFRTFSTLNAEAARIGVHPKTLRRRIAEGQLPCYRIGNRIRLDPRDVDALLRSTRNPAA